MLWDENYYLNPHSLFLKTKNLMLKLKYLKQIQQRFYDFICPTKFYFCTEKYIFLHKILVSFDVIKLTGCDGIFPLVIRRCSGFVRLSVLTVSLLLFFWLLSDICGRHPEPLKSH